MPDAELGELVAQRLAAIMEPTWDDILATMNAIRAGIEEIKNRLLLIEQHYQACPEVRRERGIQ